MKTLIDVSHVSRKSKSLRITIPKKVIEELKIQPSEILGYYLEDGRVFIEKMH
jgi:bifunctional DNA-binding transcriptional regulator/antitoxin component of YhaV-PrlF toxin-antitoxin module